MIFDDLMIFLQPISEDYSNEHHEKVNENSKIHQLFPKIAQKKETYVYKFPKLPATFSTLEILYF